MIAISKVCSKCNEVKALIEYPLRNDTGRHRNECKECRNAYNLKLYHTNDKQKENHRKASWKHQIKKNYGLTPDAYYEMLESQEGCCKICNTHIDSINTHVLYIDHCHITGKVRGLLCQQCNSGLGMFKDDPALLEKAKEYLNENSDS